MPDCGQGRFVAVAVTVYCAVLMAVRVPVARADSASSATMADAQCILVGARLSASKDQRQRLSGQELLIYFIGRIDGRTPKINLEALVDGEAERMTAVDLKNAAQRCGRELSAGGAEITRIGESLERLEK